MRGQKKKREKRDRNGANACNGSALKHFAQRNNVSLDEARVLIGQFGDDRLTDAERAVPKTSPTEKARASQTELAKVDSLGEQE